MTFKKITDTYNEYLNKYPSMRKGQCLFNAIYDEAPILADEIRGSELDPFYTFDKQKIKDCWEFLASSLNSNT